MTLKVYRSKRNFKKSTEPKGKLSHAKSSKNLYLIQKHAASHLHYDFRLELNGVLLSWAVPKGPSLDPKIKRLAIHVEDHPIAYGSFEGIIPKGEYGGGTVMLWDKGKWFCEEKNPNESYKKGKLRFRLKAKKLNGEWELIRMHGDDKTWLLIKINDEYAKPEKGYDITREEPNSVVTNQSIEEIAEDYQKVWGKDGAVKKKSEKKIEKPFAHLLPSTFPTTIYPQLATLVDKPPSGKNWLHEIKFDGYRLLIFKQGKKVIVKTRNQHDWTSKFQNIVAAVRQLPIKNLILDGEVIALDEQHHSNFQLLQNSIKEGSEDLIYTIFDLIYYDQYNLSNISLIERKTILASLIQNQSSGFLQYSDHVQGSGKAIFKKTCALGLEGIVSKDGTSKYSQTRSKSWLKTKCIKRQEFVIGGFNKSERRKYFRSLMLGTFNQKKEFIYHGNVGTGFTEDSMKSIYQLLSKHISDVMPFNKKPPASKNAVWLKPIVIAEVEFTEWTEDGTLRHPSFKGIRTDKKPKEITREKEVSFKKLKR